MVPARTEPVGLAPPAPGAPSAPSRARYPDVTGYVEHEGVRSFYEVYGTGEPSILFVPTWSIVHSRIWKAQIPTFARHHRVVTFDPRGNGRSDHPSDADGYSEHAFAADIAAVMDATGLDRTVIVSLSLGAPRSLIAAVERPERVAGLVFIGPSVSLGSPIPDRDIEFDAPLEDDEGWATYNRHFWRRDYRAFLEFFFSRCFTEPHSTKPIEDAVGWGLDTDAESLILSEYGPAPDTEATSRLAASIQCPTLVIQGDEDAITGLDRGRALADAIPSSRLVTIAGGGHIPNVRDPVKVNLLIRSFIDGLPASAVP